ncbi:hypothetical protein SAMD00019534_103490 [Acytostelium subglobosum LB1]|uniref:hypothetical protein n=1 Tax=Acytostelium subglobosum LB1 TaxID=1410327 RepID=UPI000644F8C7|nr:hypothetical protein SAMD00019534_103490 [Acytostelium subglobosum LB1]GAM27174.1 hypothetical protein SAMD00019534_103490 [Acytostelium subglobosum LB1]|eukprot:XP_012750054.1 hypothetical protein SAMD00019534_103490 [Acytostelium subglobosum LB1]
MIRYRLDRGYNVQFSQKAIELLCGSNRVDYETMCYVFNKHPDFVRLPCAYLAAAGGDSVRKLTYIDQNAPPPAKPLLVKALQAAVKNSRMASLEYLMARHKLDKKPVCDSTAFHGLYKVMNAPFIRFFNETFLGGKWMDPQDLHCVFMTGDLWLVRKIISLVQAKERGQHLLRQALKQYISELLTLQHYTPEFDSTTKDHFGVITYVYDASLGGHKIDFNAAINTVTTMGIVSREHQLFATLYLVVMSIPSTDITLLRSYSLFRRIISIHNLPLLQYITMSRPTDLTGLFFAAVESGNMAQIDYLLPKVTGMLDQQRVINVIGFASVDIMSHVRQVLPYIQWSDLALERAAVARDLELITMLLRTNTNGFMPAFTNALVRGCVESAHHMSLKEPALALSAIDHTINHRYNAILFLLDRFDLFKHMFIGPSMPVLKQSIMEKAAHLGYMDVVRALHSQAPDVRVKVWPAIQGNQPEILRYILDHGFGEITNSSWVAIAETGSVEAYELVSVHFPSPNKETFDEMCSYASAHGKLRLMRKLSKHVHFTPITCIFNAIANGHLDIVQLCLDHCEVGVTRISKHQIQKMIQAAQADRQKNVFDYLAKRYKQSTKWKSLDSIDKSWASSFICK